MEFLHTHRDDDAMKNGFEEVPVEEGKYSACPRVQGSLPLAVPSSLFCFLSTNAASQSKH